MYAFAMSYTLPANDAAMMSAPPKLKHVGGLSR